jgi:hypothetical protein
VSAALAILVPGLIAAVALLMLRVAVLRDSRMPRYDVAELADPDRDDPDMWPGVGLLLARPRRPVTHLCPPDSTEPGSYVTPCCGEDPFGLPRGDRLTPRPERVTCGRGVL